LNDTTRAYFERMASVEMGQTAADMRALVRTSGADAGAAARLSEAAFYNAVMRTTCVATRLEAGHANNALPQTARAVVNCRILPQERPDDVVRTLAGVVADTAVAVTPLDTAVLSPPSPLVPEVFDPIARITREMWGDVPVVPEMETGATDGIYLRNAGVPVYGGSGVFLAADDIRAHGRDEPIGVRAYYEGVEYTYRLVKALAGGR